MGWKNSGGILVANKGGTEDLGGAIYHLPPTHQAENTQLLSANALYDCSSDLRKS